MTPEGRNLVAEAVGLWSWGGMLEVVAKHVDPERESFYNTVVFTGFIALLAVMLLLLFWMDQHVWLFLFLYFPLQACLLEPMLQRSLDRRFGRKVQDAILEVGPEFHRRTHYELEYCGKDTKRDCWGRPVILLVPKFPERETAVEDDRIV